MRKLKRELPLKLLSKLPVNKCDMILVGRVVGAHGIKGVLKVRSFAESSEIYGFLKRVLLELPNTSEIVTVKLRWAKVYSRWVRVCLEGVDNRNVARSFIGSNVYSQKSDLPELEEGTYFWSDLIGMAVFSNHGNLIGYIGSIICTGSNDVYVVDRCDNGFGGELLIPAIESVVLDIDSVNTVMTVDLPDGLV